MKIARFLLMSMVAFFFYSCAVEEHENQPVTGQKGPRFLLNYQINAPSASGNTRASLPAEDGESVMNTLHILFFEHSSGGTGKYVNFYQVPAEDIPATMSGTINLDIQGKDGLSNSSSYILLLIANGDAYIPGRNMTDWLETLDDSYTENDVINTTMSSFTVAPDGDPVVEAWDESQVLIRQNDLLMTTRSEKLSDQEIVDVRLVRALSRFDVEVTADGCTLETVSVWNAFPTTSIWQSNFNDYGNDVRRIKRFYGKEAAGNVLKGGIYSFENYVASPEQNDQVTTCLILGIKANGVRTYYRANIHPASKIQALKRNNAYKVVVQRVREAGGSTELDAYGDPKFLLDLTINDWMVDENGSIQYDGENILALPTTNMVFLPEGGTRVDNIFTLGAGHILYLSKTELPYGITAKLEGNTLTVNAAPSNQDRSGYVELRFGNLVGIINISQSGLIEQYLNLSAYEVPEFGYAQWNNSMVDPIQVTSSGPWTATVYNGPYFTFQSGDASVVKKQGVSGNSFTLVTSSANPDPGARYSFVHVVLDEFPDISRVLILTQSGTGGLELTPSASSVTFNAFGNYVGNEPTFAVNVNTGAEWEIVKMGANPDQFTATNMSGTGPGAFTITAIQNALDTEQSATFRVRLKDLPGVFKEITITQSKHSLSLNPTAVANIPAAGGNSGLITVTSTASWKATMVVENGEAYFGSTSGTTVITGDPGDTFVVTFDATTAPGVSPKVTVTVEIEGTEISKTLVINQTAFPARTLYVQSYNTAAGWWGDNTWGNNTNTKYFTHFRDILKNPSYFGPTGTIYTGTQSVQNGGWDYNPQPTVCIANLNGIGGSTNRTLWKNWLTSDDRNFAVVTTEMTRGTTTDFLQMFDSSYDTDGNGIYPSYPGYRRYLSEARNWCTSNSNRGEALWNYLTKTGPFRKTDDTDVDIANVSYINGDGHNTVIDSWASTTIPLIMTNGRIDVAVDPTHNMLIIGDFELFGSMGGYNSGAGHQPYSSINEDSQIFLKNLVAYVVNVAMYGDTFNNQFK